MSRRCAALLLLATLGGRLPAQRPAAADGVAVLREVMEYRRTWLGDTTKFAACTAFARLGRPADLASDLGEPYRALLDRDVATCDPRAERGVGERGPIVLVDTVVTRDSLAEVRLTVRRGEYVHRQRYRLRRIRPAGDPTSWSVSEVTLSAGARVQWVPRRSDSTRVRAAPPSR